MSVEFLNAVGARFLNFAVPVSLNGSLFWLVVATLAVLFRKKSTTFLHALWLTALVAFLIPPQLPLPNPFPVSVPEVVSTMILPPVVATEPVVGATISWQAVAGLFWLGIVGLLLAIFMGQSFRFFLLLRRAKPFDLAQKSGLAFPKTIGWWAPKIYLSPEIGMPLTTGTLLPKIFLPAEAESWPEHELDLVLKHEFAHIRRGDLLFMKFQALVQILFFFHPLVWITNSLINYYRELACDDATLSQSANQAVAYSKIILKTIDRARKFQYACLLSNCFGKNKSFLIRRFKHILKQKEEIMLKLTRFEKLVIASLVVLALAIACGTKGTQVDVGMENTGKATTTSPTVPAPSQPALVAYDTPPQPIGGFAELQKNLKYPESARKANIEGRVFLKVQIDENGNVSNTEISKSLEPGCDNAAIEAVKSVKWQPALQKNRAVKVWITVPVIFANRESTTVENTLPADADTTNQIFVAYDEAPEPIGGFLSIQENLKYPESARNDKIEGRVFLKIAVNENGDVFKTEIIKSLNESCDAAAIEAVQKTKWIPAKQRGKPVKVWISIPIIFSLNKNGLLSGKNFPARTDSSGEIFVTYDVPPEPIGGFNTIQKNLKYPESAREKGIEGRVFVKVALDENAEVFKTEIIKSLGKDCDAAAIEAIQKTKWKPAHAGGKPVKVWISIPVIFKLN